MEIGLWAVTALGALVIYATVFGVFGHWVALKKNRSPKEGLILGALFGPLGVLVEAALPTKDPDRPGPRERMRDLEKHWRDEA